MSPYNVNQVYFVRKQKDEKIKKHYNCTNAVKRNYVKQETPLKYVPWRCTYVYQRSISG